MSRFSAAYNHAEAVKGIRSWFVVVTMAYVTTMYALVTRSGGSSPGLIASSLSYFCIAVFLVYRCKIHQKQTSTITLLDGTLSIPALLFKERKIAVSKINSVQRVGEDDRYEACVLLGVERGQAVTIERRFFKRYEDYLALVDWLEACGRQKLTPEEQLVQAQIGSKAKPPEVLLLLSILLSWVVMYLLASSERSYLAISDDFLLAGANIRGLLSTHEYYRLFSAFFLHGYILHLLLNGMLLAQLGHWLIRIIGVVRFLTILLLTSLAGTLVSSIYSPYAMSIGASGGLYGLFAAYLYLKTRFTRHLPAAVNPTPLIWLIAILILDLFCAIFVFSNIDVVNHVCGFAAGYCWCLLTHPGLKVLQPVKTAEVLFCSVLVALYCYGLVAMLLRVAPG